MAFLPRFSFDDSIRAYNEWGANCGPTALAAMTLMTLDEVRPHMGDFEQKHYTNPTLMWAILNRLGVKWQKLMRPEKWPRYGLALIQFEGPWTAPNVPARAAYRHTHWVGVDSTNPSDVGIYDCNAITNPRVMRVTIMCSSQVGKSDAFILNTVGYYTHIDPSRMMIMQPTIALVEGFSKERLSPMYRDTPVLSKKVNEKSRFSGNTIMLKQFPGGYVALVGANSPSSLSSRPIRIVLADEIDRYPASAGDEGDPLALAETRTDTYWNKKMIRISTPTIKDSSRIELAFEASTQEIWHVPCPVCGKLQPLEWGQIVFDKENTKDIGHSCHTCGVVSSEVAWKTSQQNGVFIAKYPEREDRGFHLNSLASPWKPWKEIADELLEAKRAMKNGNIELMKKWVHTRLGQSWEEQGETIDAEEFLNRREEYGCEVPERVLILTAGVDVQDDRLEIEVVGWGIDKESWGIRYTRLYGDPKDDEVWEKLDAFLLQPFYKANGSEIKIACTCVDSGYLALKVYRFCKPRESRYIYAIKGQGGAGTPYIGNASTSNRVKATLFPIGVDAGKDMLMNRLKVEAKSAGEPNGGYCHFPLEADKGYDEYYFNTLTAEKRVLRYVKGRPRYEWVVKRTGARNEGFDLRNYATAALEIRNPILKAATGEQKVKKRKRGVVSRGV